MPQRAEYPLATNRTPDWADSMSVARHRMRASWSLRRSSTGNFRVIGEPVGLVDFTALVDRARSLLAPDTFLRAHTLAEEQMRPSEQIVHEDWKVAMAFGALTPSEVALGPPARLQSLRRRHLLLELGQALSMVGEHEQSAETLGALASCFVDPQGDRAEAEAAAQDVARVASARFFEREVFKHWGEALSRLGFVEQEAAAYRLAVRRGVWKHPLQRPLNHFDRSLSGRAFWEAKHLPAALALEAAAPRILAELLELCRGNTQRFAKYESRVVASGGWSDVQFYAGCRRDRANCELCPVTAAVVASRPEFNTVVHGSHFFSRLVPGTHLSAHCGPSNFRLRCHLGLVVPKGLRIRVGTEVRSWKAGECLIFDDSYEHEVWHEGSEDRIVLICDMWHPSLDLARTVVPLLNPPQREALESASRGEHLPLIERTYSTGTRVVRED